MNAVSNDERKVRKVIIYSFLSLLIMALLLIVVFAICIYYEKSYWRPYQEVYESINKNDPQDKLFDLIGKPHQIENGIGFPNLYWDMELLPKEIVSDAFRTYYYKPQSIFPSSGMLSFTINHEGKIIGKHIYD